MAVDDRWIIREIAEVVATATDSGQLRATGDQIPRQERVPLLRRKVELLRVIAHRLPNDPDVRVLLSTAKCQLQQLTNPGPLPGVERVCDAGPTP